MRRTAMILRSLSAATLALTVALGMSCSVNVDELENGVCPAGRKSCKGLQECFPIDDPGTGCANAGCAPCRIDNAKGYVCRNDGACAYTSCDDRHEDCDGVLLNGCEVDITQGSAQHCGGCKGDLTGRFDCTANPLPPHTLSWACASKTCIPGQCETRFANCDTSSTNGCESDLSRADHCGFCLNACPVGQSCVDVGGSFTCK